MTSLKRSLFISFAEKYSTILVQFITSIIIARILSPHDIGLFSVGAAIIGVAHTVRDFGVSNYLTQTKEITLPIIRTTFGITLISSLLLSVAIVSGRGVVSEFYHEPAVREIMLVLGLNFVLIPFSSINIALLRRELRMGAIYKVNISGSVVQSATAILLALNGFGFMSLAWSGVACIVTTVILSSFYHPQYAFIKPSFSSAREVLSFSGISTLSSMVWQISQSASDLIIGKTLSFTSVGIFSRATGLVSMVERVTLEGISPFIMPYFSQQNRSGENLKNAYIPVDYQIAVARPILAGVSMATYPLIYCLYGATWVAASPVAALLCLGLAFRCQNTLAYPALMALGKPR